MSLDTVLKIGKALRNSKNKLKYFKYVEACPKNKKGEWPLCITIPINTDFTFNWDDVKITPENERDKLFYLKFKTSNSDSLVKYIFGDIFFEKKAKINNNGSIESSESGFYRLSDSNRSAAYQPSSFFRGNNDYKEIIQTKEKANIVCIEKFHETIGKNIKSIETILEFIPAVYCFFDEKPDFSFKELLDDKDKLLELGIKQNFQLISKQNLRKMGIATDFSDLENFNDNQKLSISKFTNLSIFLHFEFIEKKHWYQFDGDMEIINKKLLSGFVDATDIGIVLKKTLYKTLCSGDKKNDIQFPGFSVCNRHKSKLFQNDTLQDLFYALDYTNQGKLISGTDIKMIVLPKGDQLTASDYEEFREKKDEVKIGNKNKKDNQNIEEPLFDFFSDNEKVITSFDLIFCKKGGLSSPDKDLIELSGIEKSRLRQIKERIGKISNDIYMEKKSFLKIEKEFKRPQIGNSFLNILGYPQADSKTGKITIKTNLKYKSHLLKVLPLIYTDNYYQDEMLLPAFIQNVEYSIRSGDNKFNSLKFDVKFLFKIQNSKKGGFMKITESESYQIGLLLGELAKNLRREINAFDKKYVGNLTRRIATIEDFIKFKNEIEEKLIMHDKTNFTFKNSSQLSQKVKTFSETYVKDRCAFGFFESYFNYEASSDKKKLLGKIGKIISDYNEVEALQSEVHQLSEVLENIK